MHRLLIVLGLALWATPTMAQAPPTAPVAAAELQALCIADNGTLWGVSLCGPLIVVDPSTRAAWATRADSEGVLRPGADGGGWTGILPAGTPVANTSVEWGGVRWIMVLAPLPEAEIDRRVLLAHEAWHRIQEQIGLPAQPGDALHLDSQEGRTLMRLEMRALATALLSNGHSRRRAIQDALHFRAFRLSQFPDTSAAEASLDRNEGLAAYTGVKLAVRTNPDLFAARTLDEYDRHDALGRTYAYATGPAYGLLLDAVQPSWRTQLQNRSPADLLAAASSLNQPSSAAIRTASQRYAGDAIAQEESARGQLQQARIEELRARFNGARIELPLGQAQMEFDPNQIIPIPGLGQYYHRLTLRDVWGEFVALEGALISPDFSRLLASGPGLDGLSGIGWDLRMAPGFEMAPADDSGIVRLRPVGSGD